VTNFIKIMLKGAIGVDNN